jgi:hypothetical protein
MLDILIEEQQISMRQMDNQMDMELQMFNREWDIRRRNSVSQHQMDMELQMFNRKWDIRRRNSVSHHNQQLHSFILNAAVMLNRCEISQDDFFLVIHHEQLSLPGYIWEHFS